jgi:hypothetical protein
MNMSTDLAIYTEETVHDGAGSKRAYVTTPYQATKMVNAILARAGVKKILPPQMLYTYARKGKFLTYPAPDGTGRMVVDRDSFQTWLASYLTKLSNKN